MTLALPQFVGSPSANTRALNCAKDRGDPTKDLESDRRSLLVASPAFGQLRFRFLLVPQLKISLDAGGGRSKAFDISRAGGLTRALHSVRRGPEMLADTTNRLLDRPFGGRHVA